MDLEENKRRTRINREFYDNIKCDFDWSVYYTAKECHIAMWNEVINIITTTDIWRYYSTVATLKFYALEELGFDRPSLNSLCFACTVAHERAERAGLNDTCSFCPLKHSCYPVREVPEEIITGHYQKFVRAFNDRDVPKMIKYAKQIRDDWEEGE